MDKRFASGAVVFRKEGDGRLFLLVYSGRNRIWGFPKGHIDSGEDERAAAFREIKEETGLSGLNAIEGFREEAVYEASSSVAADAGKTIEKHSIFYLAETSRAEIIVDNEEITDYRWATSDEAMSLLVFDNLKSILSRAADFLAECQNR